MRDKLEFSDNTLCVGVTVSHSTIAPGLEYDEGKLKCNQSNVFIRRSNTADTQHTLHYCNPAQHCPALSDHVNKSISTTKLFHFIMIYDAGVVDKF